MKKRVVIAGSRDFNDYNYWSKTLPEINVRIHALPCVGDKLLIGGANDGTEDL